MTTTKDGCKPFRLATAVTAIAPTTTKRSCIPPTPVAEPRGKVAQVQRVRRISCHRSDETIIADFVSEHWFRE